MISLGYLTRQDLLFDDAEEIPCKNIFGEHDTYYSYLLNGREVYNDYKDDVTWVITLDDYV